MITTFRRTRLAMALVGLVHLEPRSGYELRKVFGTTPIGVYGDSPGAIYPALRRLEAAGLISGSVEGGESMRPRRVFRPTPQGIRTLEEWVSQPLTREDVVSGLDELMLRFAFMERVVTLDGTSDFLRSLIAEIESYLEELARHLAALEELGSLHGRLALMSGIANYKSQARWARKALEEIAAEKKKRSRK
jgi:DNA-binding PadR family transcriptional regulator